MEFRPCIDIHNGKVKQIVGSTLKDEGNGAKDNYVSDRDASFYASLYMKDKIKGAHVILLNSKDSEYYEATKAEAISALRSYPSGLQVGGGITAENAFEYIRAGASHVIVTSYVFKDGRVDFDNLSKLEEAVGKEHIVLDLSARKKDGCYYVVTDRWQKFTDEKVRLALFKSLSAFCDEFLVHGVDVEGKKAGPDPELIGILSEASEELDMPITYAGGISSKEDVETINEVSHGKLNFTVGSALDLFGGNLKYEEMKKYR
ncbi:MAG: phosphoribosylformimino-5-aminoimidazole carboxamide ribotide isomerase [Lachnospiraceae bacterium]|nr:phosphoribosylformimino-5-aminoimidazole carboxamide ribotide isomerase [Lachnospiraceae bacterium]MBO7601186.1 phosphoribosylformimino-5-aminoimidazole carboxamide ribotide isomerase [Lachnospiraceae bacterium]